MAVQAPEERFIACEEFCQRIQKKAFPETARAGEEIGFAFLDHTQGEGGLVNVIAVILTDFAEGLNADGEFFAGHGASAGQTEGEIITQGDDALNSRHDSPCLSGDASRHTCCNAA
jgi:hypothetical protein